MSRNDTIARTRLMNKQPQHRPSSASEVRQALEQNTALRASSTTIPILTADISLLDRIARGQMVGHERELAEADLLWQRALMGESHIRLVSGVQGVGKTRLISELSGLAEFSGAKVLLEAGLAYYRGDHPLALKSLNAIFAEIQEANDQQSQLIYSATELPLLVMQVKERLALLP